MRHYKVRHVGTGRTNPDQKVPAILLLTDYLENGFERTEPKDDYLSKSELEAERRYAESLSAIT